MPYPDVLYIVKVSEKNEELKYSLRSLKNLKHCRIFISGYKPSWVKEDVIHLNPAQQKGQKYQNIKNNLLTAIKDSRLSDEFILMNDDFFIMHPVKRVPTLRRIKPIEHYIKFFSKLDGQSYYVKTMKATRDLLRSWGIKKIYSYELHVPFLYNKAKLLVLTDKLETDHYPHLRTIYGNYYNIAGQPIKDVKIINDTQDIPHESCYLSTIDESFASCRVGEYIRLSFPEKTILFTNTPRHSKS